MEKITRNIGLMISVLQAFPAAVFANADSEFRVDLSPKGYQRLSGAFPQGTKERWDIYYDFLCGERFVSETLTQPFKLRIKQSEHKTQVQFSHITHRQVYRELGVDVSFRISESHSRKEDPKSALLELSKSFLSELSAPSEKLIQLAERINAHFVMTDFPGKKQLSRWLNDDGCWLIPSGGNRKFRKEIELRATDGTYLTVILGETHETDSNGSERVRYELEADPASAPEPANRAVLARYLIDKLTGSAGLSEDEMSNENWVPGDYVLAQLKKAGLKKSVESDWPGIESAFESRETRSLPHSNRR